MKNQPDLTTLFLLLVVVIFLILSSFEGDFIKKDYYAQYRTIKGLVVCIIILTVLSIYIYIRIVE